MGTNRAESVEFVFDFLGKKIKIRDGEVEVEFPQPIKVDITLPKELEKNSINRITTRYYRDVTDNFILDECRSIVLKYYDVDSYYLLRSITFVYGPKIACTNF